MSEIGPGDVVQLKSGSPSMVVESINSAETGDLFVVWEKHGEHTWSVVAPVAVNLVQKAGHLGVFEPGNRVKLKASSVEMVVERVEGTEASCVWFNAAPEIQRREFKFCTLERI